MHNIKSITQKDRYGNMFSLEMFEEQGVPLMIMIPDMPDGFNGADTDNHPGNARGTDTVPAWLTPGENVVNAEASRIPGNQEKIDQMNEQGRQMQAAQGGPIPTYASDGVKIDDELLAAIRQVESSGNDNAVSRVGAAGPYQIMANTALKPGYNVPSISLEDRFNPTKSKEFARQYLEGIAKANPDFTREQVITAYHSGAGNVAKNNLGPEGKSYFDKVMSAINPISTAKASTNTTVPELNTKDKGQVGVNDEIIRNGVSYKYNKAKDEYIDAEGREYTRGLGEFISDTGKNIGDYFSNTKPNPNYGAKEGEVLVGERNGTPVYRTVDGNFVQLMGPNQKRLGLSSFDGTEDEIVFNKIPENKRYVVPKPEEKNEGLLPLNPVVNQIIAETDTGDAPDQPTIDPDEVTKEGFDEEEKNPGFFKEAVDLFTDVLGDMFPPKDIARMAINYIGSRALGYEHNGSLNYTMKQYATRAELQAEQEFELIKANADKYTTASYNNYIISRNPSVLEAKGTVIEKPAGSVYITGYGQAQSWQDEDGIQYIKSGESWVPLATLGDLVQPYDKEIHGDKAVINSFSTYATAQIDVANANYNLSKGRANDIDYDTTAKINPRKIGEEANSLYRNILRSNGININNADYVRQGIQAGIDNYTDAVAAYQAAGKEGNPPGNLESYVRQQMITSLTGINQVQVNRTLPQNLSKLDKKVRAGMDIKNPRKAGYADEYRAEWDSINTAWAKIGPTERAKWDQKAAKRNEGKKQSQWNGFTLWADRTPPKEIQSINQGVAITQ